MSSSILIFLSSAIVSSILLSHDEDDDDDEWGWVKVSDGVIFKEENCHNLNDKERTEE